MIRGKAAAAAVSLLLLLVGAGCWDRVEIDERGFVIGVAIDTPGEDGTEEKSGLPDRAIGEKRFKVTYQFVSPRAIQSSGKGGGESGKAFYNVTAEGDTMETLAREFSTRVSRSPYFEHLKMIVVSSEIAKRENEFVEVLDFFLRNHEMRRGTKVIISKDEAAHVLETEPPNEKLPVIYLNSIAENSVRSARMPKETKIGEIHELLMRKESYAVQSVVSDTKEAAISGAAVIQGGTNKLVGFLDDEETIGLNFLTDNVRGGVVRSHIRGQLIVYEMRESKTKIEVYGNEANRLRFKVGIETEGVLGESLARLDYLNKETLEEVKQAVSKEIEQIAFKTVNKLQQKFKADVIGLGSHLKQNRYKLWKEIEDDWDQGENLFSRSEVEIEVKANVRRIGTANETKRKGR